LAYDSWTTISAGLDSAVGIKSNGTLWSWGKNDIGQLGTGNLTSRSSPVQVGTSSWVAVSTSGQKVLAIRLGGSLFTWGYNFEGQLGDGTTINRSSPVQLGTSSWTAVDAGGSHTAAIRSDGALFTWGYGSFGGLGLDDIVTSGFGFGDRNRSSPTQVGTSSWTKVSAGGSNTAAIRSDNILFAWGPGGGGRTGQLNNTLTYFSPVQIGENEILVILSPTQVNNVSWNLVSSKNNTTFATRSDDLLFAWGYNTDNSVGDGIIGKTKAIERDKQFLDLEQVKKIIDSIGEGMTITYRNKLRNYLRKEMGLIER
jgi:alpha-tubulin suppressor-like RCC1 family protein